MGARYEILSCVQYWPEYGDFQGKIYSEELCTDVEEVITWFPGLEKDGFIDMCNIGGEIFKVFLLEKYNRKFNQITKCLVEVLDKMALLENLQKFTSDDSKKCEPVLDKVKSQLKKGMWRNLEFSNTYCEWLDHHTLCYLLKCTKRIRPDWNSLELYSFLYGWTLGNRRVGPGERYEWREDNAGSTSPRRVIESPIMLWCFSEWWLDEIMNGEW